MDHEKYMRMALELAAQAEGDGDVPVGCVIVKEDRVIGRGRNRREERGDATAHAEVEAIRDACARTGSWRLTDCTLYVTLPHVRRGHHQFPHPHPALWHPGRQGWLLRLGAEFVRGALQPPPADLPGAAERGVRESAPGLLPGIKRKERGDLMLL